MNAYIYRLNTKIGLTMLCLSGFELYSRWVPLNFLAVEFIAFHLPANFTKILVEAYKHLRLKHPHSQNREFNIVNKNSMEFLRSFLRLHFVRKPVMASRSVGCFLRIIKHLMR